MKAYKVFLLILLTTLMSCEDYLEKFPLDAPSSATFPGSEEELVIAINGAYNSLHFNPSSYMQAELYYEGATDLNFIRGGFANMADVVMGTSTSETGIYSDVWRHYYSSIQRVNFIISNMERAREVIDEATCDQVEAEAKFIRAWNYTYLTEFYGDVPLIIGNLTLEEAQTPRTAKAKVVEQIISDLDYAGTNLPEVQSGDDNGRVTKGAAYALKARVALYNEDYAMALSAADMVMKMDYELHSNYGDLFQLAGENSDETILNLPYHLDVTRNFSPVIMNSRKGVGWSVSVPTQWLVDSYLCTDGKPIDQSSLYDQANPFENRDSRMKHSIYVPQTWISGRYMFETHPDSTETTFDGARINNLEVTNPYATFTGYLWRKNNDESVFGIPWGGSVLSYKLMRYAEVLLIYAEAKIELNQIDDDCLEALNKIRSRAQMPDVETGLSQSEMRKVLRNERKIELAGEGFRLFDLRRWKIAEHVLNGNLPGRKYKEKWFNPGVPTINEYGHPVYADQDDVFKVIQVRSFNPSKAYLWPVPQKEMDVNEELVQNPGY